MRRLKRVLLSALLATTCSCTSYLVMTSEPRYGGQPHQRALTSLAGGNGTSPHPGIVASECGEDIGPVPLLLGCRFVRKSEALLAPQHFGTTMVVSMDGVFNRQSEKFFAMAADRMEAAGIPYTQHWGKVNSYTKARLAAAYGANVGKWIAARHTLLPDPADRAVFTNAYMVERGLDA